MPGHPLARACRQKPVIAFLLCLVAPMVQADLRTNLTPVADTALRNGLSADTSSGAAAALPVGVSSLGGTVNHGLLKFLIESVPANATLTQVTLQLTSVGGNTLSTPNYNLLRVLKNWNETDSTWNTRLAPAISWGVPGGQSGFDYVNTVSATAPLAPAPSVNPFTSAGMLADVQLWRANPGTNFGWILIADNEQLGSGKQIASREDALHSPVLTISYTLPFPPASVVLFDPALVGTAFRFSFGTMSNHAHLVEFSSSLSPTNWITLTNIPPLAADSIIHITNSAGGTERYFRVEVQ